MRHNKKTGKLLSLLMALAVMLALAASCSAPAPAAEVMQAPPATAAAETARPLTPAPIAAPTAPEGRDPVPAVPAAPTEAGTERQAEETAQAGNAPQSGKAKEGSKQEDGQEGKPVSQGGQEGPAEAAETIEEPGVPLYVSTNPMGSYDTRMPSAPGHAVDSNELASIDWSNASEGYAMVSYSHATGNEVRVRLIAPSGTEYVLPLEPGAGYKAVSFTHGSGEYKIDILEQVDGARYALAVSAGVDVSLGSELSPFLYPNLYVDYTRDSACVSKAAGLAGGHGMLGRIKEMYGYIVKNVRYDYGLAGSVKPGYVPSPDRTYHSNTGICFDYSALMCAMLRSQGVPAKLEVGYVDGNYHAWVRAYSDEEGWMDAAVYFGGGGWKAVDPTIGHAMGGDGSKMKGYYDNGNNYSPMYIY